MLDICIAKAENGYVISQRKSGFDWTNTWVAESEKSLLDVISQIVRQARQKHILCEACGTVLKSE
jgi:hypothetical protein